jgi:hypothetical protein
VLWMKILFWWEPFHQVHHCMQQPTCATMYASALPLLILPLSSSMSLTAGLRCAPDAPPNAKTAAAGSSELTHC